MPFGTLAHQIEKLASHFAGWHAKLKHWHAAWHVVTFISMLIHKNEKLVGFWHFDTQTHWHVNRSGTHARWHVNHAGTQARCHIDYVCTQVRDLVNSHYSKEHMSKECSVSKWQVGVCIFTSLQIFSSKLCKIFKHVYFSKLQVRAQSFSFRVRLPKKPRK